MQELVRRSAKEIATALGRKRSRAVERWQRLAQPFLDGCPVVVSTARLDIEDFIALDLEYDTLTAPAHIWLIGICLVTRGRREFSQIWISTQDDQRAAVRLLFRRLAAHAALPIVTFGGENADLPQLRKAASRYGLRSEMLGLEKRHFDLRRFVGDNLQLPIKRSGLKQLAEYFGTPQQASVIADGRTANHLFTMLHHPGWARDVEVAREALLEYNRDDLRMLHRVLKQIQSGLRHRGRLSIP